MSTLPPVWDHSGSGGRLRRWQLRYEIGRPGRPIEAFFRDRVLRHDDVEEIGALPQAAGYEGIETRRRYTEPQSSDPDEDLVFSARRPSGR